MSNYVQSPTEMEIKMHVLVGLILFAVLIYLMAILAGVVIALVHQFLSQLLDIIRSFFALVIELLAGFFSLPRKLLTATFGPLQFGEFWKVELQIADQWHRHHLPFLKSDDAVFAAGRLMQANPNASVWRTVRISPKEDRRWHKERISAFCANNNIQAAMIELKHLQESQAEMARLKGRKAVDKAIGIDWKDVN